jgi:hypothetical protein
MGAIVSKKNKDFINNNWDKLKCSPIGPFLQMIGVGPGDPNSTSSQCKASEFSSQFNSSMSEHINVTNKLSNNLNVVQNTMNKFRTVIASMEQRAFEDISMIATQIFNIYVKIGNMMYVIIKNLMNIMSIFKATINLGSAITKLLIAFIDLVRVPVNGIIDLIDFFTRGI